VPLFDTLAPHARRVGTSEAVSLLHLTIALGADDSLQADWRRSPLPDWVDAMTYDMVGEGMPAHVAFHRAALRPPVQPAGKCTSTDRAIRGHLRVHDKLVMACRFTGALQACQCRRTTGHSNQPYTGMASTSGRRDVLNIMTWRRTTWAKYTRILERHGAGSLAALFLRKRRRLSAEDPESPAQGGIRVEMGWLGGG